MLQEYARCKNFNAVSRPHSYTKRWLYKENTFWEIHVAVITLWCDLPAGITSAIEYDMKYRHRAYPFRLSICPSFSPIHVLRITLLLLYPSKGAKVLRFFSFLPPLVAVPNSQITLFISIKTSVLFVHALRKLFPYNTLGCSRNHSYRRTPP